MCDTLRSMRKISHGFNAPIIVTMYNLVTKERRRKLKRILAVLTAALITGLVGFAMLAVGVNAVLNPNTVPVSNTAAVSAPASQTQTQVEQLQSLIEQYQNREQQYQARLDQDEAQLEQYQSLLMELQRRGVIRVNRDGSLQLRQSGLGPDN